MMDATDEKISPASDNQGMATIPTNTCSSPSDSDTPPDSQSDLFYLSSVFASQDIQTIQPAYAVVVWRRSRVKTLTMRLQLTATYPDTPLTVTLTSDTLSKDVVGKLEALCKSTAEANSGNNQVQAVVDGLSRVFSTNRFLSCADEIKLVKEHFSEEGLKLNPKKGSVKLKLQNNLYRINVTATVPDAYPDEALEVKLSASNFPDNITQYFRGLVDRISVKLQKGCSLEEAVAATRPRKARAPNEQANGRRQRERVNKADLREIRDDMRYISRAHELKKHKATDKKLRRKLVRMTRKEREKQKTEDDAAAAQLELERNQSLGLVHVERPSTPSLWCIMKVVKSSILDLPSTICQVCSKTILPSSPQELKKICAPSTESKQTRGKHKKLPIRGSCGHWFHYKCLGKFLSEPPFGVGCAECGQRVVHSDWSSDLKTREKRWTMKQAKKKELEQITDFLGLDGSDDEEFAVK